MCFCEVVGHMIDDEYSILKEKIVRSIMYISVIV